MRERLVGLGYHEIVTIPLVDKEHDALFRDAKTAPGDHHQSAFGRSFGDAQFRSGEYAARRSNGI